MNWTSAAPPPPRQNLYPPVRRVRLTWKKKYRVKHPKTAFSKDAGIGPYWVLYLNGGYVGTVGGNFPDGYVNPATEWAYDVTQHWTDLGIYPQMHKGGFASSDEAKKALREYVEEPLRKRGLLP